jgi:hypothetical protein
MRGPSRGAARPRRAPPRTTLLPRRSVLPVRAAPTAHIDATTAKLAKARLKMPQFCGGAAGGRRQCLASRWRSAASRSRSTAWSAEGHVTLSPQISHSQGLLLRRFCHRTRHLHRDERRFESRSRLKRGGTGFRSIKAQLTWREHCPCSPCTCTHFQKADWHRAHPPRGKSGNQRQLTRSPAAPLGTPS